MRNTPQTLHAKDHSGRMPQVSVFRMQGLLHKDRVKARRAFTLIEMMVAVSIFAIVMLVGVGALLSLIQANARAQAINSVMNNLNAALESMSRTIRVGTTYHCETSPVPPPPSVLAMAKDCAGGGGVLLAFEGSNGNPNDANDQVVYRLNGKQLERSLLAGVNGSFVALTAPEVSIDQFNFYVVGSAPGDGVQPRVLVRIQGSAQVPGGKTTFTVQASVVERLLDI